MKVDKEVNQHFVDFISDWGHKFYMLVGSYGSSKSYHVVLKIVLKCLKEKRKVLVVREVYETIRESCFSLFEEICEALGLVENNVVKFNQSPMKIRFSNGSQIIFKGMDKPAKLKSINGITIIWIEEASELKYSGFKELLGRARHPTQSIHFILSENPVDKNNWTYRHFFIDEENKRYILDDEDLYIQRTLKVNNTYYHHSTVDDNKFATAEYIAQLDDIKTYDLDLYRVARLGHFGTNGTRVLPNFTVAKSHDTVMEAVNKIPANHLYNGMDFGFEVSYNALVRTAVDVEKNYLYIYDEYYKNHMTDDLTVEEFRKLGYDKIGIAADNAEPKTIAYYQQSGINMRRCKKGAGSRLESTKKIKRFKKIICSPECKNTIKELKNLTYQEDKNGTLLYDKFNIDPHTFSAIWYGLDVYSVPDLKDTKNNSRRGG